MTKKASVSLITTFLLLLINNVWAVDSLAEKPSTTVKLQLKWMHQFQFAGYYAAKEQGYYAEEGLDVDIRQREPAQDHLRQVVSGEADFGIGDAGIIAHYAKGEPIVALAAIFQHDALVLFSKQNSGIISPYEMAGKRIMFDVVGENNAPIRALLEQADLNDSRYAQVAQSLDNKDFILNKVDVISGYLTDKPDEFQRLGVKYNIINPQNYGIDFYGDLLFTSQNELIQHPGRAERFLRASLKGWRYALDHSEEIIQLILHKYQTKRTLQQLRFEAEETRKLIMADKIPLGQIEPARLRRTAAVYSRLGLAPPLSESQLNAFVPGKKQELELSEPERLWLAKHPVIRVGIDRDFAPYEWLDQQGHYRGMVAEYLQLLQKRLGVRLEVVKDKSWQETLDMAKRGELDMIAAAVKTPDREQYLNFTQAYVSTPAVIIGNEDSGYIATLLQLNGRRVAVEQGYFIQELLSHNYPTMKLVPVDSVSAALMLLAKGEADAYIGDAASANYTIKKHGLHNLRVVGQTDYVNASRMAVTQPHPELLGILDKALASIPQNEREAIINKWMGLNVTHGISIDSLRQYAVAAALIFLMFSYWVFRLRREVKARRRSEAELAMLYTNMSLGFALHEAIRDEQGAIVDFRYQQINPAFEKMTGISRSNCVGKTARQLLPNSLCCWMEHFAEVEASSEPKHLEIHAQALDAWFTTDCYKAGPNCFVVLLQDITDRKKDELALKASEERLRISQYYGGIGTWEYDMAHNRQIWSEIVTQGLGFPKTDNPTWSHFLATISKEDRPLVVNAMRRHLKHGSKFDVEFRINVSGQKCWMRSVGQVQRDQNGKPLRMLGVVHDISERKQAEEKLRLSARVFSEAREGIIITDVDARIIEVNAAFTEITGYSREEVIGKNPRLLKSGQQNADFYRAMWQVINSEGHWQGEIWNRKKNGDLYAALLTISALRNERGNIVHYLCLFSDITETKQQQQDLEVLAHYDPLTKLPNRSLFTDRFNQAIAHSKRNESLLAVCYLDLDGFKQVNDTFGHEVGDELLVEVARRIKANLREGDTVCRLGGDEFVMLFDNIQSLQQCEDTLKRIHHALADAFALSDRQIRIAASSGVTLYPLDREEPDILLRHADQAMYQAKLAGRNCFRIYQELLGNGDLGENRHLSRLQEATAEIQQALALDQFRLYFQPKVNMKTGEVFGAEVLIRWQHPQRGLLLPGDFWPIVASTPQEIEISHWVIRQTLQQLQAWLDKGVKLQASVNVSAHFLQSQDFLMMLNGVLAEYPAVSSRQLELEVMENSVLDDLVSVGEILRKCYHQLGVTSAIDDFGNGYSSLSHLRHLSVNSIKIGQPFVRDMINDPDDQAIVESIVGLAKAFKREVIAEGVEQIDQGTFLINLGCSCAQGYAIAKPMPAADFLAWANGYSNPKVWSEQAKNRFSPWQTQLILLQLQQEHWLSNVQSAFQASLDKSPQWPILNPKKSHLGRWLTRMIDSHTFDSDLLKHLEQQLILQCQLAQTLHKQHQEGNQSDGQALLARLKHASDAISHILRQLEMVV